MTAPTITADQFFKQAVAQLAAETPRDNVPLLKAIAGLTDHITRLTEDDPDRAKVIFNDVLNQVDPAWRVKVSD